jgi:uncharacterized protein YqhQ
MSILLKAPNMGSLEFSYALNKNKNQKNQEKEKKIEKEKRKTYGLPSRFILCLFFVIFDLLV